MLQTGDAQPEHLRVLVLAGHLQHDLVEVDVEGARLDHEDLHLSGRLHNHLVQQLREPGGELPHNGEHAGLLDDEEPALEAEQLAALDLIGELL